MLNFLYLQYLLCCIAVNFYCEPKEIPTHKNLFQPSLYSFYLATCPCYKGEAYGQCCSNKSNLLKGTVCH